MSMAAVFRYSTRERLNGLLGLERSESSERREEKGMSYIFLVVFLTPSGQIKHSMKLFSQGPSI